jgi:hypothetical protein
MKPDSQTRCRLVLGPFGYAGIGTLCNIHYIVCELSIVRGVSNTREENSVVREGHLLVQHCVIVALHCSGGSHASLCTSSCTTNGTRISENPGSPLSRPRRTAIERFAQSIIMTSPLTWLIRPATACSRPKV